VQTAKWIKVPPSKAAVDPALMISTILNSNSHGSILNLRIELANIKCELTIHTVHTTLVTIVA
jgi:hypothetical protein